MTKQTRIVAFGIPQMPFVPQRPTPGGIPYSKQVLDWIIMKCRPVNLSVIPEESRFQRYWPISSPIDTVRALGIKQVGPPALLPNRIVGRQHPVFVLRWDTFNFGVPINVARLLYVDWLRRCPVYAVYRGTEFRGSALGVASACGSHSSIHRPHVIYISDLCHGRRQN